MGRRCSHCYHDGHNSRTCPNRGVRLFGVRLTDGSFQKSASTGNLAFFARSTAACVSTSDDPQEPSPTNGCATGYASDDPNIGPCSRGRKKGVPWSEHEHKMFLLGLKKLGKGDWRGIARSYVISRTPTQVASHAQKYFIRHSINNRRKRRVSLFDIVPDESTSPETSSQEQEMQDSSSQAARQISEEQAVMNKDYDMRKMTMKYAYPPPVYPIFFPMYQTSNEYTNVKDKSKPEVEGADLQSPATMKCSYPPIYPSFFFPCWPGYVPQSTASPSHEIIKPMAVYSKSPIKVDELLGMSRLSLGACNGEAGSLNLNRRIAGGPERQSAFHAGASSRLDSGSNPIHAS